MAAMCIKDGISTSSSRLLSILFILFSLCEFCLSVGFFSAKLFSLKWLLCSESSKAAIWLLIGMLKYLLSTLKPPLHITLVVLLSSFAICLCVVLYFWHKYRGWQASKGRKRREPTPTELTFKLHPIPPGSKGTALNVRLNSEICMKKICFLLLSKGFKGTMKLHQSATSFFCPYVYQLGRTWMQRPSDFSFIASDDGCKSIYSVCLSLLSSCISAVLTGELLYLNALYHNNPLDVWCTNWTAFEYKASNQMGTENKFFFLL